MSINKLALVRYKTIDTCLQNRFRKWTLNDLVEACANALYEYEGITKGISVRAIQLDIQNMRSEKLGYNAPIIVTDKKFYSYDDKNYSINNTPITEQDLSTLNEVLAVLNQFKGFGYFQELNSMVTRLEDKLYKQQHKGKSFIDFEKNELLKGLKFIDPLHKAIINKHSLEIVYQSFKAKEAQALTVYPYLLKEYRNRWFLLCKSNQQRDIMLLALDRIESVKHLTKEKYHKPEFEVHLFFNNLLGVTKTLHQKTETIVFFITKEHAPYLVTKPMHASQAVVKVNEHGTIFSIEVVWNFELERELLGFGEHITVISPKGVKRRLISRSRKMLECYKTSEDLK
jgi:predicted DNA-binding transcriptional regulator YafY